MCSDTKHVHGEIKRGTKIICYFKEDRSELLKVRRVEDLIKKYSEFVGFHVELYVEKSKEKEVTDSEEDGREDGDEPRSKRQMERRRRRKRRRRPRRSRRSRTSGGS